MYTPNVLQQPMKYMIASPESQNAKKECYVAPNYIQTILSCQP